ncbi:uncharacterized protein BYT42DRAFT_118374 [Radiomyces spectabilis]|uniref:uncharacterized protein n=1 Tax=Radiomyces spectabilis TaxID=64574 RepID=UPI002220851F|nr:uncharacterized protein BYT42DRAFT_118374 [Radiomyces spectabilis]KAI8368120.1 hypothetical protein BYT42DRAFT_118374 [Radiomyces spectabilis]
MLYYRKYLSFILYPACICFVVFILSLFISFVLFVLFNDHFFMIALIFDLSLTSISCVVFIHLYFARCFCIKKKLEIPLLNRRKKNFNRENGEIACACLHGVPAFTLLFSLLSFTTIK